MVYWKMVDSSGVHLFSFLGWSGLPRRSVGGVGTGRTLNAVEETELRLRKTSEGLGAEVERLITPGLGDLGYEIVCIVFGGERRPRLQLMIERLDGRPVDVEDCAAASRYAAAILDVEDPITTAYVLEVSSPGIDRPLTRLADFCRFAGHLARLEVAVPIEGRRRFSGTLIAVEGENVLLDCEEGRQSLAFDNLVKAKLVLTDALIAEQEAGHEDADEDSRTLSGPANKGMTRDG